MRKVSILFVLQVAFGSITLGQFPPPAGQPGTTAMYMDSTAFIDWASQCTVERGYVNFVDTTVMYQGSNKASYGMAADATGPPDNFVVSLGDRGVATLQLNGQVYNGPGPDFAVFENAFDNSFLELGFVEVSSDGQHFVRFPAVSLTPESPQVPTFGTIDATKIHNFAGKYRVFFGTPFDLSDLTDSTGINLNTVTSIRIIDVGGCILPGYQSFDSQGHIINDPWPTPFNTCGLDLDAVGIIHLSAITINDQDNTNPVIVYPNPVRHTLHLQNLMSSPIKFALFDSYGTLLIRNQVSQKSLDVDMSEYPAGIYFINFTLEDGMSSAIKVIKL
ncbi:MAG: T9SS type A sorting domain-containing protein [bacterium]